MKHLLVYAPESSEFQRTFEEYADSVSSWPGMFFEMDGSFVWSIPSDRPISNGLGKLQLDGMLYDRAGRIEYLDLKGSADRGSWLKLFWALLGPMPGSETHESEESTVEQIERRIRIYDVQKGTYVSVREAIL